MNNATARQPNSADSRKTALLVGSNTCMPVGMISSLENKQAIQTEKLTSQMGEETIYINTKIARRADFNKKKQNRKAANKKAAKAQASQQLKKEENEAKMLLRQKLENQSGFLDNIVYPIPLLPGIDSDKVISSLENCIALFFALRSCTDTKGGLAIIFQHLKLYCSGSILKQLVEYLRLEVDIDLFDNQSTDLPAWLRLLKQSKTDWLTVSNNKAFKKVSTLLSMAAALGLCDLAQLKFDINGIRVFSVPTYKKHINATDLVEAAFDTFLYFVEGGYQCFVDRSLKPFLFSGDEAAQFEQDYFLMLDLAPFMRSGNLENKKGITENDFDKKLNDLIDKADNLYKASTGTWEKKVLFDRLVQLRKIRSDFISYRTDGKMREAPFACYIEGKPGVGKSSITSIAMRIALMANGFDASDERLITLKESDKYDSTYKSFVNGIYIDDIGNTMPKYAQKSPAEKIIELVNNVPTYANMAEAELKGKVPILPKVVNGTSNVPVAKIARQYSQEPASVCRRFPVQLYVRVKSWCATEDGRLDSTKVKEFYGRGNTPPIPDCWEIDIYEPFDDSRNDFRRLVAENVCIYEAGIHIKNRSREHFDNQHDFIDNTANLDQKLVGHPILDDQSNTTNVERLREFVRRARAYDSRWLCWTNYMPESYFDNSLIDSLLAYLNRSEIFRRCSQSTRSWISSCTLSIILFVINGGAGIVCFFICTYLYMRHVMLEKAAVIRYLRDANGAMPIVFKSIRDNHIGYIAAAGTAIGVLYTVVRAMRSYRALDVQGNLQPVTEEDIQERDAEKNPWAGVEVTVPHADNKVMTSTAEQVQNNVFKNLHYLELDVDGKRTYCDAFFWKSNLALIPDHMWKGDEVVGTFYRKAYGTNGASFKANLSRNFAYKLPNTDLVAVWIPNTWSVKDMTPYIAEEQYRSVIATMIWKSRDGQKVEYKARLNPGVVRTHACDFHGFNYVLDSETYKGLCMGTWVSDSVRKQIIGFHLGGSGRRGGAGAITREMLEKAEFNLRKKEGLLVAKSQGTVLKEQYGKTFYEGPTIHAKSPTRYLPTDSNIDIFGSVTGRMKYNSEVVPAQISHLVEDVCGIPQQWGKPKFNRPSWRPWQVSLEQSCRPSMGMEGVLLQQAVVDYKIPLVALIRNGEHIRKGMKKLTRMETICGRDGVRFIDAMSMKTSVGFPLAGPKSEYITELNPEDYPEHQFPRELDDVFWKEFESMCDIYRSGKRAYPVFKASLKDEPTKLDKDKVRVFQAAPLTLQLGVRMYFLPVVRVLSIYPIVSECAVGINAQGPEWDQLAREVRKYGSDRILAGDYSKYDLRMSSQLMSAAFRILIDLARESGNYTDDDFSIMEGLATDICQPLMAYNGDYIQHVGSNPSGQNLTVYINSIVNSLLFRCAYFHICKNRKDLTDFRSVCSLITYGDDAKSSVKEGWDEFNHISVAKFLEDRDMKFTMPDKESTPTKYMTDEDADLLKRKNIVNPETGLIMGALDEMSIFKSLHSVLKSKAVSNEEQCISNIDGALREWFAHGKDTYEMRRTQMKEIAERAGIAHGCTQLDVTYDECVDRFCETYNVPLLAKLEN